MILKNPHALLAALALMAAPAMAQDAAPAADPAEQPAETAAPEAAAAPAEAEAEAEDQPAPAAEGQPAEAEGEAGAEAGAEEGPRVGSYYPRETHGDWTIRCIKTEEGPDPCELYQLLTDDEDNAVAEMTLIPLQNGDIAAGATLIAPLETDLVQGLGFGVDNAEPRGYPFSFCAPVGCVSRMGFTPAELNGLKRGNKATIRLLPFGGNPEQPVQLDMSLAGFTAAFAAIEKLADEARAAASATPAPAATENGETATEDAE